MEKKINLEGSLAPPTAKKMTNLCQPLKKYFDVTYFRYTKIFEDGSRIVLCNIPEVIQCLYEEERYKLAWLDKITSSKFAKTETISWAIKSLENDEVEIGSQLKNSFNLVHGKFFSIKYPGFVESFE